MKKLISNKKLLTATMISVIGLILAIVSVIYFIQSYSFYSDEWGTDISFSEDAIVLLLCSITLMIFGLYSIYAHNKNKDTSNVYYLSFGIISLLISFYPLGQFIKGLAKGKGYLEVQDYLYISIVGIVMLGYIILSYLNSKKK